MSNQTRFSFEVYRAESSGAPPAGDDVMQSLAPALEGLLAAKDNAARVTVSDSHKGGNNRIVEIVTTLQDAELADVLKAFGDSNKLTISALE